MCKVSVTTSSASNSVSNHTVPHSMSMMEITSKTSMPAVLLILVLLGGERTVVDSGARGTGVSVNRKWIEKESSHVDRAISLLLRNPLAIYGCRLVRLQMRTWNYVI